MGVHPRSFMATSIGSSQNPSICSRRFDNPDRLSACFQSAARANGLGCVMATACSLANCKQNQQLNAKEHRKRNFLNGSHDLLFIRFPKWATRESALPLVNKEAAPQVGQHTAPWHRTLNSFFSSRTRSIILLNLLSVLYGSNATVIKEAENIMDPATLSAVRFAIATLAFSPFLLRALKDDKIIEAGFELGILSSMGYLSQSIGLMTSEAGRASFICALTVIVVPLLAGLSGSHIPKIMWISAAVALLGIGLLESSGAPASIGDLWNLIGAVSFGIHMLRTEHFSRSLPSSSAMPLLSIQLLVVTLLSGFWAICKHVNEFAPMYLQESIKSLPQLLAATPWVALFYTGFLSTAFCLWVELVALRDVSSTEAAIIYTLEPLWGAGFAWMFLGERWGAMGWLGSALILGGSLMMQLFGREVTEPTATVALVAPSSARGGDHVLKNQIQLPSLTESEAEKNASDLEKHDR